ncbi:hypothetical protein GCM10022254_08920 [Actinomadura meridiana]|uniref:Uncharacterized protein n=1 Tax=Actinomadura meridiana TaxID=559626 RepID=A0ABP8BTL9_9ACTN
MAGLPPAGDHATPRRIVDERPLPLTGSTRLGPGGIAGQAWVATGPWLSPHGPRRHAAAEGNSA